MGALWSNLNTCENNEVVHLSTGVSVPLTYHHARGAGNGDHGKPFTMIVFHGLGSKNPKNRSHQNDEWIPLLSPPATELNIPHIMVTVRGHGQTTGWEKTASSDPDQFTWKRLASDMVAVADHYSLTRFIACGSSMGSATSLYTAMLYPDRVAAVIMIRPPTAWAERQARHKNLLASAHKLEKNEGGPHYLVLQGAAQADLPPINDRLYNHVTCPLLILTVAGDDAHPLSTARALAQRIPHAELHIAPSANEAKREWYSIIANFLSRLE